MDHDSIWIEFFIQKYSLFSCIVLFLFKYFTWLQYIFFLLGEMQLHSMQGEIMFPELSTERNNLKLLSKSSLNTICNYCGKNFLFESRLRRHLYIHTGERPFVCRFCNKSFNQKASLGQHILTHSDRKPYMCDICGKQFIKRSIFFAHSRTHSFS